MDLNEFYKNKKILVTGNSGFKGAWLCELLLRLDADVAGYALEPSTTPNLFDLLGLKERMISVEGDIRDFNRLKRAFDEIQPEIVVHMAAQPIVRESYANPVYTYDVNVMGTVNVLECVRLTESVKCVINVTTDKVYLNRELNLPFKEDERLCGFDPYSNSKSCSELVTYSYKYSFFGGDSGVMDSGRTIAVSTCRAGNVIGGGDFAKDRIIPDCVRALEEGRNIIVRNPYSIRPYQHVLEPLYVYLKLAMKQYADPSYAGAYNVGPDETDCISTGDMVTLFCNKWNENPKHEKIDWVNQRDGGPHEASFLKLDSSKTKERLEWKPRWSVNEAMDYIIEWTDLYLSGKDVLDATRNQIESFLGRF